MVPWIYLHGNDSTNYCPTIQHLMISVSKWSGGGIRSPNMPFEAMFFAQLLSCPKQSEYKLHVDPSTGSFAERTFAPLLLPVFRPSDSISRLQDKGPNSWQSGRFSSRHPNTPSLKA